MVFEERGRLYDLCAVAAGWVEGFEEGLKAWDVAAGGFIVQESGGYICDWEGGISGLPESK